MKKTLKTIVMMICVMEIFFTHTISNVVYAKDLMISDAKEIEKAAKSLGFKVTDDVDKSKYQFMSKKIKDEKGKYTGVIEKAKENKLNECGVFDEEIMALSEEERQMIVSTPVEDLYAFTSIYAYVEDGEGCENEENIQSDINVIELTSEQIDKMYAQEYYGEDNKFDEEIVEIVTGKEIVHEEEKSENVVPSVEGVDRDIVECSYNSAGSANSRINNTDFNVVNVCESITETTRANSSISSTYTATGKTSFLKKTLYATMKLDNKSNKNEGYIYITYTNQWIKMPDHRMMDIIKIEFINMQYKVGTGCTVTHKVYREEYYEKYIFAGEFLYSKSNSGWVTTTMKKDANLYPNLSDGMPYEATGDTYDIVSNYMYIAVPMHNDCAGEACRVEVINGRNEMAQYLYSVKYTNEQVTVQTTLRSNRTSTASNFELHGYYFHQYSSKKINVAYQQIAKTAVNTAIGLVKKESKIVLVCKTIAGLSDTVTVEYNTYMNASGPVFRVALEFKYK